MNDNINEAYRARLIDGIYNKNVSNRDLLYAKIHQQLEVSTSTSPEKLDKYIEELAITNQKLFLLDKMFGGEAPVEKAETTETETD